MNEKLLEKVAKEIQQECHQTVELIFNSAPAAKFNHQDAVNAFTYRKLAEMEIRLRKLEGHKHLTTPLI